MNTDYQRGMEDGIELVMSIMQEQMSGPCRENLKGLQAEIRAERIRMLRRHFASQRNS